jgi:hypothetical protein
MPVLTHEQLHQLLAGLASLQKLNGEVFAQTELTERGKFSHSHYVAALRDAAGSGDPTDVRELLACMILARTTPHSAQSAARNEAWELAQVRRLFP